MLVSLDDIRLAAGRIRALVRRTPLLEVPVAEAGAGRQTRLLLKCECFQPGGAFKIRGACNMIAQLRRRRGQLASSPTRLAITAGRRAGRRGLPGSRRHRDARDDAAGQGRRRSSSRRRSRLCRNHVHRSQACARRRLAKARGLTIVPPFDHPWIIAGQGTTGSRDSGAASAGAVDLRAGWRWRTDCRDQRGRQADAGLGSSRRRRARRRRADDRIASRPAIR